MSLLPSLASSLPALVFFRVLLILGNLSVGKPVTNLQVTTSHDLLETVSFICSDDNTDHNHSGLFRDIKLVQVNATGHKIVWAVLNWRGQPQPNQDFVDILGNQSFFVSRDFREDFHRLQVTLDKSSFDLHMRSYGQFYCVASYREPVKETEIGAPIKESDSGQSIKESDSGRSSKEFDIGHRINLVPGTRLPVGGGGFRIVKNHAVDLVCQASIPTLFTGLLFTIQIIRLSDNTAVASWKRYKAPACSTGLKVACSGLQCVNEVCFGKVRLFTGLGDKYKCHVEDLNKEQEASEDFDQAPESQKPESCNDCTIPLVVTAFVCFMLGVFISPAAKWIYNKKFSKKNTIILNPIASRKAKNGPK